MPPCRPHTPNGGGGSILLLGGGGGRDSWFQQCAGKHAFFSFKLRYYWGAMPPSRLLGGGPPLPPCFRRLCLCQYPSEIYVRMKVNPTMDIGLPIESRVISHCLLKNPGELKKARLDFLIELFFHFLFGLK